MKKILSLLLVIPAATLFAQSIHPLEPAKNHYADFAVLSAKPNPERAELDTIIFPASSYSSVALLYTMATPAYLLPSQIEELKKYTSATIFDLPTYFDEEFFETKKVVHLGMKYK